MSPHVNMVSEFCFLHNVMAFHILVDLFSESKQVFLWQIWLLKLISLLYSFPKTVVTQYYKLVSLKW